MIQDNGDTVEATTVEELTPWLLRGWSLVQLTSATATTFEAQCPGYAKSQADEWHDALRTINHKGDWVETITEEGFTALRHEPSRTVIKVTSSGLQVIKDSSPPQDNGDHPIYRVIRDLLNEENGAPFTGKCVALRAYIDPGRGDLYIGSVCEDDHVICIEGSGAVIRSRNGWGDAQDHIIYD